jgi:hypothetical protein
MSFAPFRDRSITLTLESELTATDKSGNTVLATNAKFVNRFLPKTGLAGFGRKLAKKVPGLTLPDDESLTMKGVTYISVNHAADVASEPGVVTSFLQPWFIKPVAITLRGTSYLGAYPLISVSDRDVENLLKKFRAVANDYTSLYGTPGSQSRVLLELNGYPRGARRFLGYLKTFNWTEDVKNANLLDYTLEFLGRNVDGASLQAGKDGAKVAKATSEGRDV